MIDSGKGMDNKNRPEIKNNADLLLYLLVRIKTTGKWWLLPLLIVLAFLSIFVSLTGNTAVLPAIYALF